LKCFDPSQNGTQGLKITYCFYGDLLPTSLGYQNRLNHPARMNTPGTPGTLIIPAICLLLWRILFIYFLVWTKNSTPVF